ncbi:MAG: hypothetical protein M3Y26_07925 [Actinomycetota bacterium]|nr:hypothetical protein [Actinomycetota bacterium]
MTDVVSPTSEGVRRSPGEGTRCLTVVVGPRRYDIVVDEQLLVAEVLALVSPGSDLVAMTMAGVALPLGESVTQARVAPGSMILTAPARTRLSTPRVRRDELEDPDGASIGLTGGLTGGPPALQAGAGSRAAAPTPTFGETRQVVISGDIVPGGRSSRRALERSAPAAPRAEVADVAAPVLRARLGAAPVVRTPRRPAPGPAKTQDLRQARRRATRGGFVLIAVTLALLAALGSLRVTGDAVGWTALGGVVMLVVGLVVVQLADTHRVVCLVSPVLGVVGGVAGASALASGPMVPLIGGCAGGAIVALAGRATGGADRHVPRVWLAFCASLGGLALAALALGLSAAGVAAIALAVVALVSRTAPDLVVDVDDDVLLDINRLSVTSWSPREARRRLRRGWRIDERAVGDLVRVASIEQAAVLLGLLVVTVGASAVLFDQIRRESPLSSALLLTATMATLALTARGYRRRRDRVVLRSASAACLVALTVPWVMSLTVGDAVVVAVCGVGAALVAVALAIAVGGGYRSLWAGRIADLLEMVALVSALPLALWSAGLVARAMGLLV